jgi:alpha-galactosidase
MTPERVLAQTHTVEAGPVRRFYRHGWHSWCPTGWVDPSVPPQPIEDDVDRMGHADPLHVSDALHGGSELGAVEHDDGSVTLLGALRPGAWVRLEEGALVGEYEEGDGEWVVARSSEEEAFSTYARLLAGALGRRGGSGMRLWASWYSYYEDVSAEIMDRAVDGLADLSFDVIQVDDGWEKAIGDWEPNERFPSGAAATADRIRSTGRRAGLWLAPFIVREDSQFFGRFPDLLLKDAAGDPVVAGVNWGGPYYALDVTMPAALDHVEQVMGTARDWGFDVFKLDFLYGAALPGDRHEPMGRETAYRLAAERIRSVVGEESYLLACGAPIIASVGVFDGIRVGPDVGPVWDDGTWNGVHRAMVTSVHRLWLRSIIDVDPDVAYLRSKDIDLSPATMGRVQALAHIAGFKGSSDPPDWLLPEEHAALDRFLEHNPSIERSDRYVWTLDGAEVDFEPAVSAGASEPEWSGS